MIRQPVALSPHRFTDCPKSMTNGPCGGVALDGSCEVDHRPCTWATAAISAGGDVSTFPSPPPDWAAPEPFDAARSGTSDHRFSNDVLDRHDRPWRQRGRFETVLRAGGFAVTAELNPPDSGDAGAYLEQVKPLIGLLDAVHISDNSLASPHMCGLAAAALIERMGLETILHMTCRDRNRNMLQADLLGASAVGVKNVLCLTGDHPAIGDHPTTKPVFDLDAVSWIDTARHLRDERSLLSGRPLSSAPDMLIGGGAEPTAAPLEFRPHRLASKVAAGIDFAVTQVTYDMNMLSDYMRRVCDLGLNEKIYILVSVGAIAGPAMARGMNNNTPGVVVPDDVIRRLEGAPKGRRREEGVRICVEQIQQIREMPGVSGIDIMDIDPGRYAEVVSAAGLSAKSESS